MFHVKQSPLNASEVAAQCALAPPVLARLERYVEILKKWQKRLNLVGGGTLDDVWRRHILDSAQLHALLPGGAVVLDMGSGAGFPGLVLAIMGNCTVHLVESDARKCAFLFDVIGQTETGNVHLHNDRVENLEPFGVDVVTARALAGLDKLLDLAAPFLTDSTICLFQKGQKAQQELTESLKNRTMAVQKINSRTDPTGTILKLSDIGAKPRSRKQPDLV